ncbi:polysaccharide deacetylase family protein [Halalkalibacterium halodurans]|uniref:polysaccharide deacetylase family protein n=1 Tax=Halalkalibacterium halodurans TaxID=86665 RepID=UPI002AA9C933|nr:polysaccharide deacetylase family protein [Halalkalibacterium halodurans]MDY7224188.1 hypothetical protein [Halalkalibacterium halodurans]MDY7243473.1 hypothetical protein [Halalkalibacterium halodurans]
MNHYLLFLAIAFLFSACSSEDVSLSEQPNEKDMNESTEVSEDLPPESESPERHSEGITEKVDENVQEEAIEEDEKAEDTSLVPYEGDIEHIFFHPLMAYPELSFSGPQAQGYNDWFITIDEFHRTLEELYKQDFILIYLEDVYEKVDGEIKEKTLELPEGKKPLVLSIDDVNYYDYMREEGNVYQLILDDEGQIATYSINPEGEEVVSYENEIIPILDTFVEEHPDFSHEGAKGVIALTGYEGVLGYRTNDLDSPHYEKEKERAIAVVERLKETGWTFGSHSYGHIDIGKASLKQVKRDTKRWKNEVEIITGSTPLYFFPFGSRVSPGDERYEYLVDEGYEVLAAVGPTTHTKIIEGAYTQDRRRIDGMAFIQQPHLLKDLLDSDYVLDRDSRPERFLKPDNR